MILKVNCETVGSVGHVECGRNLGRIQFFTHRLAALRLLPGDRKLSSKCELVGVLVTGR